MTYHYGVVHATSTCDNTPALASVKARWLVIFLLDFGMVLVVVFHGSYSTESPLVVYCTRLSVLDPVILFACMPVNTLGIYSFTTRSNLIVS